MLVYVYVTISILNITLIYLSFALLHLLRFQSIAFQDRISTSILVYIYENLFVCMCMPLVVIVGILVFIPLCKVLVSSTVKNNIIEV